MRTTLSLRRLNETCPALVRGAADPAEPFGGFGARIAEELRFLEDRGVSRISCRGFLPLDLLRLFPPSRRGLVLTGGLTAADWEGAAAVRMAELLGGRRFPADPALFATGVRRWSAETGPLCGNGAFLWTKEVLSGRRAARRGLTEIGRFHGAEIGCFLGRGSTSAVYGGLFGGKRCAVKLPVPGAEPRFRRELAFLEMFSGKPFFPELYAFSGGETPWCVIPRCRTGACVRETAFPEGFQAALDRLHRCGLRHGDLRRANLGLGEDGRPVLLDFSHTVKLSAGDPAAADEENRKLQQLMNTGAEKHERSLLSGHGPGAGQTVA